MGVEIVGIQSGRRRFVTATTTPLVTFEELERISESEGCYELRHGELVKLPPPIHEHGLVQWQLLELLRAAVGDAGIVRAELGFRALPDYEYRVADVAFVAKARWESVPRKGYLQGAPEIVMEVLSPSNSAREMLDKEQLCLENGAREFWVVDPFRRQVKVSTADGRAMVYKPGTRIPLLFGGSLDVDTIFV